MTFRPKWNADTGFAEAERRIVACKAAHADGLDLGGLRLTRLPDKLLELRWLKRLDLWNNRIGAEGAKALAALTALTSLNLQNNAIGDEGAKALAALTALTSLNLQSNAIGDEGAKALAALTGLTSLGLGGNEIGAEGAKALAALTGLSNLDLVANEIGAAGAKALAALTGLTSLSLVFTGIGDEGAKALAALTDLATLELVYNAIGDEGAKALAGLSGLTSLDLGQNEIGHEGAKALAALTGLTSLSLWGNKIGDEGATALAALSGLTNLNLENNGITDLRPLTPLVSLASLDLSRCNIRDSCPEFWANPSLRSVYLCEAQLGDVPPEVLSRGWDDNCLDRLRAHFRDLASGAEVVTDVKFMILGNGRIGKTQICRRLRGEPFDPEEESTHGIRISTATLPARAPGESATTLKVWDFGGQDIYLGTHTLFLKSRAIFPVVWTQASEKREEYEHGGLIFRNYPLDYWVQYVEQMAGTKSPLLLVQNQCDQPADEALHAPVHEAELGRFAFRKPLIHYSAKTEPPRGHDTLLDALRQAVAFLNETGGISEIGSGRAAVKRRLEEMQQGAQAAREKRAADPEQGWITKARFIELCEEAGGVSEPGMLLDYLHQTGTVFYDPGLFHGHIIVDQQWALDAIYSVFERGSGVYKHIRDRRHGRFTASELASFLWDKAGHDKAAQELFISMMRSCSICFRLREAGESGGEAEYVAPDLLPDKDALALELADRWDTSLDCEEEVYRYDLLPPTLLRTLMASIGEEAGLKADYWQDGLYFYDAEANSRALVEQTLDEKGWGGSIRIRTQKGDAEGLLARLCEMVDREQERLGVAAPSASEPKQNFAARTHRKVLAPGKDTGEGADGAAATIQPAYEPAKHTSYYVSYAWGIGGETEEDRHREAVVDRLCEKAKTQGIEIIRDRNVMRFGDSISRFMSQLAGGNRVYVVLSEKYLRSPFCMYELHEIHRECRSDNEEFLRRISVFSLPDAKIYSLRDRAVHIRFWKDEFDEANRIVEELGNIYAGEDALRQQRLMGRFAEQTGDILAAIADTLHPTSIEQIEALKFDP